MKNILDNHIVDNKTQPIFDYSEFIFEKVYVETPLDTDNDGKLDLIAVYIKRPKETLNEFKVPAIYVANPYMMTCNEEWYIPHNVNRDIEIYNNQNITEDDIRYDFNKDVIAQNITPRDTKGYAKTAITKEVPLDCIASWYSYFNSRGYASVFCAGLGTKGSQGFNNCGSVEEKIAFKSVIDWLNGRCRAFTNKEDNIEIKADWCTGNVAMSGKSYLGTMCIAVATTGVEGLKTIIPEAAISNWYEYYRYNGLNLPAMGWQGDDLDILAKYCFSRKMDTDYDDIKDKYEEWINNIQKEEDRKSGNYNKFWDERNYLNLVMNIKASTFIIHGINDWNVKTSHCDKLFKELEKHNKPRKMILHQGEHIYIDDLYNSDFIETMHLWLDYNLYNIENKAMDIIPNVKVQSNINQDIWHESQTWPCNKYEDKLFILHKEDTTTIYDDLSLTTYDNKVDNTQEWLDELVLSDNKNSIKYISEEIKEEMRISGTVKVSFKANINRQTAVLSAMIVDYGEDTRLTTELEIVEKDATKKFTIEEKPSKYRVISRGWINAQNRNSIYSKECIDTEKTYEYNFDMIPTDYTIKKNHKLGVIIYGIDPQFTEISYVKTKIDFINESVRVVIPYL